MLKVYVREIGRFFVEWKELSFMDAVEGFRNHIIAEKIERMHIHTSVIYAVLKKISYEETLFYAKKCEEWRKNSS